MRKINKIKVIKTFPGYAEGDVLTLNDNGIFIYAYNENDPETAFNAVFTELEVFHGGVAKNIVNQYLNMYFMDISEYELRSKDEIELRLSNWIENIKEESLNDSGKEFYSSLAGELEWVLGKRG